MESWALRVVLLWRVMDHGGQFCGWNDRVAREEWGWTLEPFYARDEGAICSEVGAVVGGGRMEGYGKAKRGLVYGETHDA